VLRHKSRRPTTTHPYLVPALSITSLPSCSVVQCPGPVESRGELCHISHPTALCLITSLPPDPFRVSWCSARDLKEVILCIEELRAGPFHGDVVCAWVLESFEKKEKDRKELPGTAVPPGGSWWGQGLHRRTAPGRVRDKPQSSPVSTVHKVLYTKCCTQSALHEVLYTKYCTRGNVPMGLPLSPFAG